jgi:hypothetical protein
LCAGRSHTYGNAYLNIYSHCITYAYSNADPMHRKMFTHAEAAPDVGWATHSASSFNTAA